VRRHLLLIKLGGSLITDKRQINTFRPEYVTRIAKELAELRQVMPDLDIIMGTGAGSFGHFTAHEYRLREGATTPKQVLGMAITHNATQRLSGMVADLLTTAAVPALSLPPAAMITAADKEVHSVYMDAVHHLLGVGISPVLHGDTVVDGVRGTTIFSTERVLQVCLEHFRPTYDKITVLYAMDANGLLDKNGVIVRELAADDEVHVQDNLTYDVTGGIVGKITSARKAAELADTVYLVPGKSPGSIHAALRGEPVGTRVLSPPK
jgi:isopentenyl phosphate kinase